MNITYTTKTTQENVWLATIVVKHGDESIVFNEISFFKSGKKDHDGTFDELNGYLATLPDTVQQHIFDIYKQMKHVLSTVLPRDLLEPLKQLIAELYDCVSIDQVNAYVYNNRLAHVPASLPETNAGFPPATTYIKSEYVKLINLSILLHMAAPIIADYITRRAAVTGKQFKESAALALFDRCNLIQTPEWIKLKEYIAAMCSKKPVPLSATLAGLSEEQFPNWMLSSIIARKLCINHVRRGDDSHLVAQIYAYINYNTKLDGKFGGGVMQKTGRGGSEDEREKPVIENWKVKQDIYETDVIVCANGYSNPLAAAQYIEPGIPQELLIECFKAIPPMWNFNMTPHQRMLMEWVHGDYIPPKAIALFDYTTCCTLVAITQAILWHRGFKELAVIVGTYYDPTHLDESDAGGVVNIEQLTQSIRNELEGFYNIIIDRRAGEGLVTRTIEDFVKSIIDGPYRVVGPDKLLAESGIVSYYRWLVVPRNLRYVLADYIRFINKK